MQRKRSPGTNSGDGDGSGSGDGYDRGSGNGNSSCDGDDRGSTKSASLASTRESRQRAVVTAAIEAVGPPLDEIEFSSWDEVNAFMALYEARSFQVRTTS